MIVVIALILALVVVGIIIAVAFPRRAVSMALTLVIIGSIAFHFWTLSDEPWLYQKNLDRQTE